MKCKTCQHAIKLHKHPLNRMFNGAISEQVDFIGCIALGKDNGLIVDRVVEECEGWMKSDAQTGVKKHTNRIIEVNSLKDRSNNGWFNCVGIPCGWDCGCIFDKVCSPDDIDKIYDFAAIKAHDFGTLTEVTIEDLEQFKIK